jgi:prepilin-type N-terminal cleavage/methylation domain-containing protein
MHVKARQSGFTLIELLIVLFIAAILGYAVVTQLPAKQPTAVKGVTNDLAGSLIAAQSLARNSGRQVFLQTSGGGGVTPVLQWGYVDNNEIVGSWTSDTKSFAYASVSIGMGDFSAATPVPNPSYGVPAIQSYVTPATWASSFFDGSSTPTVKAVFDSSGAISNDIFVAVCGRSNGKVYGGCPMGVIVVGRKTGLGAFYKPNASDTSKPWQRL